MSKIQIIICAALAVVLVSCSKPDNAPIKIKTVRMSAEEFDRLYKMSHAEDHSQGSVAREEFLEEIINRKLMLLEAERMGLDRDPQFLREVQDFWQERLLTSILRIKGKEYKEQVQVTDEEIKEYFDQHSESFAGMELEKTSDNIKRILLRSNQQMMMGEWLKSLRGKTNIEIDYSQLGIQP